MPDLEPMTAAPDREILLDSLFGEVRNHAILALDSQGAITRWGAGAEALTGHSAAELEGQPLSVLWQPGRQKTLAELLQRAANEGSSHEAGWHLRRDGSAFWAETAITPLRSAGRITGYAVILRDATRQHDEQQALELSRATFEGILAIASDAVVCVSEDQRITFFNGGAETIFGYSPAEVVGQPLELLLPESARPVHNQHIRNFAESGVSARRMGERGEIAGRRKTGEVFPAEASISQLHIAGRRVFTAVLRDVTERRRAEEAIASHALELARSNAELEQFAYVASHDLQEPLRMVASFTQLLARRYRGKLDADADEFIGYAVDGVHRMQALINDLLAYSRVGTRGAEPVDVPLDDVLKRVVQSLGPSIQEAGATVTSDALPVVRGDPGQLAQLLQNLIGNAIKFKGEAAPHVHVSAERQDREWVLSVQDNGIGVAPEFRERIFVIFQRLHSRAEFPGTGIGLSICRKIVERHGGRIWVDESPGGGSLFRFTLPVEK
jgi:PAS domain S-box-containing protein